MTRTLVLSLAALFLLSLTLVSPGELAAAGTCDRSGCGRAECATPAAPAPSDRWGGLRPVGGYTLCGTGAAFCTDSTAFIESQQAYWSVPWFMSVDTENQYLFIALAHGLQVWDAHAAIPQPVSQLSFAAFPVWSVNPEVKWPLQDVDAPAGVDDEVALAGLSGIGIAIVDLADKTSPKLVYQNYGKEGNQVYAATLGGRRYAFLAAQGAGLFAYDMTQAKLYKGCSEEVPNTGSSVQCPGVYRGRIGTRGSSFLDGVDTFVVSAGGAAWGVEIWDMGNPASPQLKLSALNDRPVYGVALWKQGATYYLAARTVDGSGHRLSIYDVSCIAGSSCSGLGAPLSSGVYDSQGTDYLDFSRSNGTPFLYLGSDNRCAGGTQREWLLDVSNPAAPQDISPFNYWGWYYRGGPTGFNLVAPRSGKFVGDIFYRAALSIFDYHQRTGTAGGGGSAIDVSGPDSGLTGTPYSFTAAATGCTPSPNGWSWSTGGGSIAGAATGAQVSVTWTDPGTKPVSATNSACGSAVGLKPVSISGTGSLSASFTYSPSSPQAGQPINFDATSSSGGPTQYAWDFGDGTTAAGPVVSHSYTTGGSYTVLLTISRSGSTATAQRGVAVASNLPPPPDATFQTSAVCSSPFGIEQCPAETGTAVSFTANATGALTYSWDFGDGTTATGRSVSHTWSQAGSYGVTLTVSNGQTSATSRKVFQVTAPSTGGPPPPPPPPPPAGVLIPWIAETTGALVQTTDLYVYNPGSAAVQVTLTFRKRGLPDTNPPQASRTIAPGATLFFADVLKDLFSLGNVSGFFTVTPVGTVDAAPVVASFNTTLQGSSRFGQTVPGLTLGGTVPGTQNLVGLNDDGERLSYFGVTNPNPAAATYRVRFFDATGRQIAVSSDLTVSPYGQKQFQVEEIRATFGVSGRDYRVQVETVAGGPLYPYASVIRLATDDPSFLEAAVTKASRAYLVGALSAPGPLGALWRSDAVLANPGAQALHADLTFTSVGPIAQPTAPVSITLQPGETRRLTDVIQGQWGISNAIGILTLVSREPSGALPVFQGESYNNANPSRRFGQSMMAQGDDDAAGAGQRVVLAGLRQDAAYRTTLWLFNPSGSAGTYDLIYRALDGTVLGRLDGIALGAGKARQLSPSQHPLPAAGAAGGLTVEAVVRSGKLLAGGQVVNNATNDPAYVLGAAR
ncbi:MAG TPA: PKD domain-containing protein [Thermoanaerobaculia bacterium]|nr:PKD domain-containing protein [Thermoanaerobaculia bacterium]